ncbi:energy-coupling factor ABC transporter ATP-binding protein [Cohnella boryungensis]|uniref:Energy-coupling factor ABC transporter ATP-binding protein n=1 Tax=Cohnella boryungensis TaxID=768479 RepID=A0ABV8SEP4_9BACL
MAAIMEFDKLHYRYSGTDSDALRGLSLRLPEGRKIAICGANGSGKSTMFLHAIGLHRPQSGQLSWRREGLAYDGASLRRLRRQVGLVFQDPEHQLILNTPYEDITYGLRNADVPEPDIRLRTEQIIETMGLSSIARLPIHHLSLGQKKRVALAGVLVLKPELLLLDEPTAYLDRLSERQLLAELDRAHAEGVTVAMATHDMNLAYSWADWILVLNGGECVIEGTPAEVFAQEHRIDELGLELPMLYELWRTLPQALQERSEPPRSLGAFKALLGHLPQA